jgi:membrane associated rhomboid family serine protease
MGIYDREYYRKDGPGFLSSLTGRGQVCRWLIGINVAVFVLQFLTADRDAVGPLVNLLTLDVEKVLHGEVWRLLTYAFVHDPGFLLHIVLNMWFLWMFGNELEDLYGSREFLAFYLTAAIGGGVAFVLGNRLIGPWMGQICYGASGAVTAVMVLGVFHFPHRQVYLMFVWPAPMWVLLPLQLIPDLYNFLIAVRDQEPPPNRVAVTVHLAGALFAYVYFKRSWRLLDLWASVRSWKRERSRPRLRVYHEEAAVTPEPPRAAPLLDFDEQMEAKVDAVLEKVARTGQDSLTENERQILLRASEVYKRRRS